MQSDSFSWVYGCCIGRVHHVTIKREKHQFDLEKILDEFCTPLNDGVYYQWVRQYIRWLQNEIRVEEPMGYSPAVIGIHMSPDNLDGTWEPYVYR